MRKNLLRITILVFVAFILGLVCINFGLLKEQVKLGEFYPVDRYIKNTVLFFTFDKATKIEKAINYGDQKFSEMDNFVIGHTSTGTTTLSINDDEIRNKLFGNYNYYLTFAENNITVVEDKTRKTILQQKIDNLKSKYHSYYNDDGTQSHIPRDIYDAFCSTNQPGSPKSVAISHKDYYSIGQLLGTDPFSYTWWKGDIDYGKLFHQQLLLMAQNVPEQVSIFSAGDLGNLTVWGNPWTQGSATEEVYYRLANVISSLIDAGATDKILTTNSFKIDGQSYQLTDFDKTMYKGWYRVINNPELWKILTTTGSYARAKDNLLKYYSLLYQTYYNATKAILYQEQQRYAQQQEYNLKNKNELETLLQQAINDKPPYKTNIYKPDVLYALSYKYSGEGDGDDFLRIQNCLAKNYYYAPAMRDLSITYYWGTDKGIKTLPIKDSIIFKNKIEKDYAKAYFWISAAFQTDSVTDYGLLRDSEAISSLDDLQNNSSYGIKKDEVDKEVHDFLIKKYPQIYEWFDVRVRSVDAVIGALKSGNFTVTQNDNVTNITTEK